MVRYLVRCACCDRAFWQDSRDAPVPEHTRWERRVTAHRDTGIRCDGSMRRGYWIAEGEDSSPAIAPHPRSPAGRRTQATGAARRER